MSTRRTDKLKVGDELHLTGTVHEIRYAPRHRMYEVTVLVNDEPVHFWCAANDRHDLVL